MDAAELQKPPPGELFLDHVSHFVADLEAAAELLEQLGFKVAPLSIQEVGGSRVGANRCVMLEQGYIEILTPTLQPDPGLRLACFGTPDAEAEHRRLADHGFEPQPIVELQRGLDSRTVRFKVVLPGPGKMPEGRIQYVQHLTPQHIWREEYLGHANGVTQLRALFVVADDRFHTGQRDWHANVQIPFGDSHATVDLLRKSGLTDAGPITGWGFSANWDWPRWFVRVAYDPHQNFSAQNAWRLASGVRF